jgi:two-component system, response regulator RegA
MENNPDQANLLLVDDDEVLCHVLSKALAKRHYNVQVAHSLDEALSCAHQHPPEFAVVNSEPGIRIVVLTGYASISTAVESIKLGAIHYLTKPAEVDDIIQAFYHEEGRTEIDISTQPMSVKRMEWEHLQKVLNDNDGNISAAARAMGMHRRTLQRKLAKKPVKQ